MASELTPEVREAEAACERIKQRFYGESGYDCYAIPIPGVPGGYWSFDKDLRSAVTIIPALIAESAALKRRLAEYEAALRKIEGARRFINGMTFSASPDVLCYARETADVAATALSNQGAADAASKP